MSYGQDFVLTLFTNDPELARRADLAGINRVGLDLERIHKAERQGHLRTWVSDHAERQLPAIRAALTRSLLFARTNPVHSGLGDEVERLLEAGVQVLMLPMFTGARDAERFVAMIAGRAKVSLLVETAAAAARIRDVVRVDGIDEIHVGLNDLHLSMGLSNHFEMLTSGILDHLSDAVHQAGIAFGFGGIGRVGDTHLPIPPDLVFAQYPRLKADRALVSRVFCAPDYRALDLPREVALFRERMDWWHQQARDLLIRARDDLHRLAMG